MVQTQSTLLNDEELYAELHPIRRIYARKGWIISIIGLPVVLFSTFWLLIGFHFSASFQGYGAVKFFYFLFGFVMLFVGLSLTVGHYLLYYLEAGSVNYIITSRRIIIHRGFIVQKEFEIFVDGIVGLQVIKHRGHEKAGTIRFIAAGTDSDTPFYLKRFPTEQFRGEVRYAIEAVSDVDSVRIFIEKARDQSRKAKTFSYRP